MGREYWTYLDNSNNHYEISNFGRIRNAKTQKIKNGYVRKNGIRVFNINYKDTPYKTIYIKNEMLKHFGDLARNEFVRKVDETKGESLDNLEIYNWCDIERKKKEKIFKPQSDDVWNKTLKTCEIIVYKQWLKTCKSYGIEAEDLIHEATMEVICDYDNYKADMNFFGFCRFRILRAFNKLKNKDLCLDDYVVGVNYKDD